MKIELSRNKNESVNYKKKSSTVKKYELLKKKLK